MSPDNPARLQLATITRLLLKQMQTGKTLMPQVLVHVHVLGMDASYPTLLLTFKKENGNVV